MQLSSPLGVCFLGFRVLTFLSTSPRFPADGPTIFKVKDSSPLTGVIFEGDILLAIDDIDTTAMSAADISSLMAKKGNQKRKLLVR